MELKWTAASWFSSDAMDQILRMSTSVYTLLNLPRDRITSRDLIAKTNILVHIVESSPSASFLPTEVTSFTLSYLWSLYLSLNLEQFWNGNIWLLNLKTNIFACLFLKKGKENFLFQNLNKIKQMVKELQAEYKRSNRPIFITNFFGATLRKLLREILLLFTKVSFFLRCRCIN